MYAKVIVDIASSNIDRIFDYKIISGVQIGSRVLVPFGNRQIEGYVINLTESADCDESKIKEICKVLDDMPVITEEQLCLTEYMQNTFFIGTSDCIRLFLPSELRKGKVKDLFETIISLNDNINIDEVISSLKSNATNQKAILEYLKDSPECIQADLTNKYGISALNKLKTLGYVFATKSIKYRTPYQKLSNAKKKTIVLTDKQKEIVNTIENFPNRAYLLHGITGSGKTEVYMRIIENAISNSKNAIMLVPEISLTPQVLSFFRERFGDKVALLHSGLSAGERFDEWKRILLGKAQIVVGARSAIFAPIKNVGVIVIDEEHESSYSSETHPRYTTAYVAEFRRKYNNCTLILGSATPSMVSYHKAITGVYQLLELPERVNGKKMPQINVIDMGLEIRLGNPGIFSNALVSELTKCIEDGNQAILFINRRGFASFVQCMECGWVAKCPDCDVSLSLHKEDKSLKCHYCGNKYKVFTECPECHSQHIKYGAVGTERVVEELNKLFPNCKVLRMDNDTTQTKDAHINIIEKFRNKEAQILVGTQMVAKGHDFPDVTLVGIIDADLSLYQSSYLSNEKTFALVTQVAGRAGRSIKDGNIVLQSYSPKHFVYKMATAYDYLAFYKKEINLREVTKFPPFSIIVRILFSSFDEELAKQQTKVYYDSINEIKNQNSKTFFYLNKMKSPISRIKKKFRFQILMRIDTANSDEIIKQIYQINVTNKNKNVQTFIEVNAQDLR